jgi:hypothetical protein
MNAGSSLLLETLSSGLKKVNVWTDEDNFIWYNEDGFICNTEDICIWTLEDSFVWTD